MNNRDWINSLKITPEIKAELTEYMKNYKIDGETKRRIEAFNTPVHWTTWLKTLP